MEKTHGDKKKKLNIDLPTLSLAVSASSRMLRPSTWPCHTTNDTNQINPRCVVSQIPDAPNAGCLPCSTEQFQWDPPFCTRLEQRSHAPHERRERHSTVVVHERGQQLEDTVHVILSKALEQASPVTTNLPIETPREGNRKPVSDAGRTTQECINFLFRRSHGGVSRQNCHQ